MIADTNADKRRRVVAALEQPDAGDRSDRQIAAAVGVSQPFVSRLRKELKELAAQVASVAVAAAEPSPTVPAAAEPSLDAPASVPTPTTRRAPRTAMEELALARYGAVRPRVAKKEHDGDHATTEWTPFTDMKEPQ